MFFNWVLVRPVRIFRTGFLFSETFEKYLTLGKEKYFVKRLRSIADRLTFVLSLTKTQTT